MAEVCQVIKDISNKMYFKGKRTVTKVDDTQHEQFAIDFKMNSLKESLLRVNLTDDTDLGQQAITNLSQIDNLHLSDVTQKHEFARCKRNR